MTQEVVLAAIVSFMAGTGMGQTALSPVQSSALTLEQAELAAVQHQPQMLAAQLRAKAATERIRQVRAGLYPLVAFNTTGTRVADTGTSVASGALPTSSLSNRFAYGGGLSQLVSDFGRTSALVGSARSGADAQNDLAMLTRAQVRLNVRDAFYDVLGAEAVLRAAQAAQANRHLIVRQLSALAQSELRSTLDVKFAQVLEGEAELAVVRARSVVQQRRARLGTAMGTAQQVTTPLVAVSAASEPLPATPEILLQQAEAQRADLNAAQAQQHAAQQFALSEKRLRYPTLNVLGAAGEIPYHDHTLHDSYAAAGFNLNIPVLNGGLFAARRAEAEAEATARSRDVQELQLVVSEQVCDAWYQADEARQNIAVTARLLAQTREALRLAQDRYTAGLGSIVELNEAQLNETSAEISGADATYTYLAARTQLDYSAGLLN